MIKSFRDVDCAISQTLAVIGEWWTLMIVRNAFHGMRTFDAFHEDLGISTSVLAARLKTLTDADVFKRVQSEADGRSFEYRLTEKGRELYPLVVCMYEWGEKWYPNKKGPRMYLQEISTGKPVRGVAVIASDGHVLDSREIRSVAGPGANAASHRLLKHRILK